MKIDIHRHSALSGSDQIILQNLYHNQEDLLNQDGIYSVGLHPWHVCEDTLESDLNRIRIVADKNNVLAIGETGLDKSIKAPLALQKLAFKEQIKIAISIKKPMIIHCVQAYNELCQIKQNLSSSQPWIVHWFNTSKQMGDQLIKAGFYLSFGHMLFKEDSKAFLSFPHFPVENIFLETDDSSYTIQEIYLRAASLRAMPVKDLEVKIERNFKTCFGR